MEVQVTSNPRVMRRKGRVESPNVTDWYWITLVIIGAIICISVSWEQYAQLNIPSLSILVFLQSMGFMKGYTMDVEPNRGIWHLIGWIGSGMMVLLLVYIIRKRVTALADLGNLRRWLQFHMFLGIVGPFLVALHTTFKLGGIVSVSFWSMVLVASSGFFGRYMYVQIPRTISGQELKIDEIEDLAGELDDELEKLQIPTQTFRELWEAIPPPIKPTAKMSIIGALWMFVSGDIKNMLITRRLNNRMRVEFHLPYEVRHYASKLLSRKMRLQRRLNLLRASQRIFHLWHLFHLPFSITMFIIMLLHIGVFYVFRIH